MNEPHINPYDAGEDCQPEPGYAPEPTGKVLFMRQLYADDGESYTTYRLCHVPSDWDHNRVDSWVLTRFPAERCQHSHDCCGNYYARSAKWSLVNGGAYGDGVREILVRQAHVCNI